MPLQARATTDRGCCCAAPPRCCKSWLGSGAGWKYEGARSFNGTVAHGKSTACAWPAHPGLPPIDRDRARLLLPFPSACQRWRTRLTSACSPAARCQQLPSFFSFYWLFLTLATQYALFYYESKATRLFKNVPNTFGLVLLWLKNVLFMLSFIVHVNQLVLLQESRIV